MWRELCRPELQPRDRVWELGLLRLSSSTVRVSLSPFHCFGDFKHVLTGKAALGNLSFLTGKANDPGTVISLSLMACVVRVHNPELLCCTGCDIISTVTSAAGSLCSSGFTGNENIPDQ